MQEKKNRTAAFHTLGCKVNTYESDGMKAALQRAGYTILPDSEPAEVFIVNTCSVTNIADRKSRQILHRVRELNPSAVIVATGCYAQAEGEKLLADEQVDIVLGNDRKSTLSEALERFFAEREALAWVNDIAQTREYEGFSADCAEHTRAFLKIEDGCNQFCSYCRIPYVRGRVRSRESGSVLAEAERLAAAGYREIVLTGIHLSSYGIDGKGDAARSGRYGEPLLELLERLNDVPGLSRIRLGSLEPRVIDPASAARLAQLEKLCPHFHLSLQSGCDATLKRMNRHYTAAEFFEEMTALREAFDRPALTTDVIVGFPGETEEEFEETRAFLERARFYETHIFPYSRRAGTVADRMPGQLTQAVKAERGRVLAALNEVNRAAFEQSRLGCEAELLLEEPVMRDGRMLWRAHSREYLELFAKVPDGRRGDLIRTVITADMLA